MVCLFLAGPPEGSAEAWSGLMGCGRCGVSAISINSRLVEVGRHRGVWSFGLIRSQSSPSERSTGEKGRVRVVLVLAMD